MQETIPVGPLISTFIWLIIIFVVLIVVLKQYKKRFFGDENKDSVTKLEEKFLKEIKESYNKLTEEQKRKVDNIK